jgi:hypothetical protein
VWSINTRPYSSGRDDIDHFAVMPEALVERCLLAGSSPQACAQCGSPYRRVTERTAADDRTVLRLRNVGGRTDGYTRTRASGGLPPTTQETTGWQPTCKCACAETKPCVVLDPFAGSGTTLRVATRHGRDAVGIELNPQYIELADERTAGVQMSMESVL